MHCSKVAGGFSLAGKEEGFTPSPGKLEEMGLNGCWDEDFTKALDHLSPEAGGTTNLRWRSLLLVVRQLLQAHSLDGCVNSGCFSSLAD